MTNYKVNELLYFNDDYLPNQKCSSKEKAKPEFYISTLNYVISKALTNNRQSAGLALEAANGKINTAKYTRLLLPILDNEPVKTYKVDDYIDTIDFITPIKERYLGEFLRLNVKFFAVVTNDDPVLKMNKELAEELDKYIVQLFTNKVIEYNQQAIEQGQQGVPIQAQPKELPDIETFKEDFIKRWRDAEGEDVQNKFELLKRLTEDALLYAQAFFYWWATDEVYSYRTIKRGKIVKEIVSPTEYYRVNSGSQYVCDDAMGVRHRKVSIMSILEERGDVLSAADKILLTNLNSKYVSPDGINIPKDEYLSNFDVETVRSWINTGLKGIDGNRINITDNTLMIDEYHVVLTSYQKIGILYYEDLNTAEIKSTEVSEDYELDLEAGDLDIEWVYKPVVLEGYRYGYDKYKSIYTKLTPCIFQHFDINGENPKLPYNGITGLFRYYGLNPIPLRLVPNLVLYRTITKQMISTIRKYRPNLLLLPEVVLQSNKTNTLKARLNAMHEDDLLLINMDRMDANTLQAIRNIGNNTIENFIKGLLDLRAQIKNEAWESVNMNQERYGDIDTGGGKANTQEAIRRVSIATVPMLEVFNLFREKDYNLDMEYTKLAWINGYQGVMMTVDGKPLRVNIDGEKHLNQDIGIFVAFNVVEQEKLDQYKQFALGGQNADFALASEAISAESSVELRQVVRRHDELTKKFQKEMEQIKGDNLLKVQQEVTAREEAGRKHDLDKIDTDRQWDYVIEQMKLFQANNPDVNDNGINDEFDRLMKVSKLNLEYLKSERDEAFRNKQLKQKAKNSQK